MVTLRRHNIGNWHRTNQVLCTWFCESSLTMARSPCTLQTTNCSRSDTWTKVQSYTSNGWVRLDMIWLCCKGQFIRCMVSPFPWRGIQVKKHILSDLLVDETQHKFRNLWTNQQSVRNVPEQKICLPSFGCWSAKLVTIQSKHRTWPKANNDGINIDQRWSKMIKALNKYLQKNASWKL